jgi:hypothetical protein
MRLMLLPRGLYGGMQVKGLLVWRIGVRSGPALPFVGSPGGCCSRNGGPLARRSLAGYSRGG